MKSALAFARAGPAPVDRPVDRQSVGRKLPPFVPVGGRRRGTGVVLQADVNMTDRAAEP
jgi:hypothetical protein